MLKINVALVYHRLVYVNPRALAWWKVERACDLMSFNSVGEK